MAAKQQTCQLAFGTSIGQNGCAGIYPAMPAIMAAQVMGMPVDLGHPTTDY
ncbi:hypothetical protein OH492_15515 [Vibrio chagasii]|nr:hypothetical protein [Vibrio chagasii]